MLAYYLDDLSATTPVGAFVRVEYDGENPLAAQAWADFAGFDVYDTSDDAMTIARAARPHRIIGRRVALNISGGKDSLACLELLRPYMQWVTVYWGNTGDALPESEEVVRRVSAEVPSFVEVRSDVMGWKAQNGIPVDLLPMSAEMLGVAYGMSEMRMATRFSCCFANKMWPVTQRIIDDEIEVVVRGTKLADTGRLPAEGDTPHFYLLLPLKHWTHQDVFAFLRERGVKLSRVYETFGPDTTSGPDCLHCTAVWADNKAEYLKQLHPGVHQEYVITLKKVREQIKTHLADLDRQIEE